MFEGTLRDNLDPRHVHDDTALWSVLGRIESCQPFLLRKEANYMKTTPD